MASGADRKNRAEKPAASETPVMQQHRAAKRSFPDALIFFRLGDFYELFFEDAVVAAKLLDLTLTSRNRGAPDEIPMCGVPHHAASGYIQKLTDLGYRVALCEQMSDPKQTKGIVPREVVRIATPSVPYDDAQSDTRANVFLVAIEGGGPSFGVGVLDVTTGEFFATPIEDAASVVAELVRLEPREVLLSDDAAMFAVACAELRLRAAVRTADPPLDDAAAVRLLDHALGKGEALRSAPSPLARMAAARALRYAAACEPKGTVPVSRLTEASSGRVLVLDASTQAHLELVRTHDGDLRGALLTHIDETCTAAGARLLRRRLLAPLVDVAEVRRRHDAVAAFVEHADVRVKVRAELAEVRDLERLAQRLGTGRASPRDVAAVRSSLARLPAIAGVFVSCKDPSATEAFQWLFGEGDFDSCEDLLDVTRRALSDDPPLRPGEGGTIRDGYDSALDELRALSMDGQRHIVDLEARLRDATEIPSLKLRHTRVFGWYIEVTRSHASKAPSSWRRKQTVATGERFTTEELEALAERLASAEEKLAEREAELYVALVARLAEHRERLLRASALLAGLDVAVSLAEIAHRRDYVRPEVDDSLLLEVEEGRHPVVEATAAAMHFVPNDVCLDARREAPELGHSSLWLVTGPNMAGKSTFMRQVAIMTILAQAGSFVPAKRMRLGIVDRVLTRVGASDNLSRGESTFMVEMKETANVLRRASKRSLVVLDEIGRGTSTFDGLSIAWAVAEYLNDVVGCRALFATHYHELTALADSHPTISNHNVSAREHEGELVFFHRVECGAASRSYGVACARLAGVPEPVVARARALLANLEGGGGGPVASVKESAPQLALFTPVEVHPAVAMLRSTDPNRLTPLDALNLVAQLKRLAERSGRDED